MKVAVVGGGVAGLAAALEAVDLAADVVVYDAASRLGGCLATHRAGPFLFEDGPNSIPASDVEFRTLCARLGLADALVESRAEAAVRRLHHRGRLRVVPTRPLALLASPLVGPSGVWALLRERHRPRRTVGGDESVDAFMRRRFGDRLTDTFLDAVIAGIYAGDPKRLGVAAAFPDLVAMEAQSGSVLRGLTSRRRAAGTRGAALVTLRDGLGSLADAAAARLGDAVSLRSRVTVIFRHGSRWRLRGEGPNGPFEADADAVVCALPARAACALFASLEGIRVPEVPPSAGMAVVQFGFTPEAAPMLPRGFGWLIPRRSGLRTLGCMVVSDIFSGRAPEGGVALGAFFGGSLDPEALSLHDDDLMTRAAADLRSVTGLRELPTPAFARVVRWPDAVPQPPPGFAESVRDFRASLHSDAPRCAVAGSWVDGVAVGRCIAGGRAAAREVLA